MADYEKNLLILCVTAVINLALRLFHSTTIFPLASTTINWSQFPIASPL